MISIVAARKRAGNGRGFDARKNMVLHSVMGEWDKLDNDGRRMRRSEDSKRRRDTGIDMECEGTCEQAIYDRWTFSGEWKVLRI